MLKINSEELYWMLVIIFILYLTWEYYTHIHNDNQHKPSIIKNSLLNGIRGGLIGIVASSPEIAFTNFVLFSITTPIVPLLEHII